MQTSFQKYLINWYLDKKKKSHRIKITEISKGKKKKIQATAEILKVKKKQPNQKSETSNNLFPARGNM